MNSERETVLVVEDDHLVSEMVRGMLEELGYGIAGEAEDGHEALEMVRELKPDVVLMDIKMPRMTGLEASILMQKHFPTPIVILSAYESDELTSDARKAGVGAYVVKPPEPEELDRAIQLALSRFPDILRIRELEGRLESLRGKVRTLSGLLPVCPGCRKPKSGEMYDSLLDRCLSELEGDDRKMCLCGECRKSSEADGN
ncbi:MAG: response regulator [Candidatus Aegiribacteria sp.]